jgi:hypothetical protein
MKTIAKNSLYIVMAGILTLNLGCKEKNFSAASTSPDDGAIEPIVSEAAPLVLTLTTIYNDTEYENPLTFSVYGHTTTLTTSSTTCSATDADPLVTCTVTVPENRLYRSEILFQYARLPTKCKNLNFTPYSYRASNTAGYYAPGAVSPADCSTAPIPVSCYGGAAKSLVEGFPQFTALYYTADETDLTIPVSTDITLESGWTEGAGSNRKAANDMSLGTGDRTIAYTSADLGSIGDAYIANTYRDYTFRCEEDWADELPYGINLIITDEDEEDDPTATPNDRLTWKEL